VWPSAGAGLERAPTVASHHDTPFRAELEWISSSETCESSARGQRATFGRFAYFGLEGSASGASQLGLRLSALLGVTSHGTLPSSRETSAMVATFVSRSIRS